MSIQEVIEKVHKLGNAWENFKQINDQRLAEVEKKGKADPLLDDQLERINTAIDSQKSRLDNMETKANRPIFGAIAETKSEGAFVSEYKKAFDHYLRKGAVTGVEELEAKALSVGSDPDGGYLVTPAMSEYIVKTICESSPMRQVCRIETISSDSLEIIEDPEEATAGWTNETDTRTDTATPQIGKKLIPVHELFAMPKATQKLVDDSAINIEQWIAEKVIDTFLKEENNAFVNGDGVGKPTGFLSYAGGTAWGQIERISSGTAGEIEADNIHQLYYNLGDCYAKNSHFMMARSTVQTIRTLKLGSGEYIWQPGLQHGQSDTLLGVPVVTNDDMPVVGSGNLSVAIADWSKAYQIVDRIGVRILRDPFTEKPFVKFYTTKRVGGDVINYEAIKLLEIS